MTPDRQKQLADAFRAMHRAPLLAAAERLGRHERPAVRGGRLSGHRHHQRRRGLGPGLCRRRKVAVAGDRGGDRAYRAGGARAGHRRHRGRLRRDARAGGQAHRRNPAPAWSASTSRTARRARTCRFGRSRTPWRASAPRGRPNAAGVPAVINARIDFYIKNVGDPAGRFDETVKRAKAYLAAGADCIYPFGFIDMDTIERLAKAIDAPINIVARAGRLRWPARADRRRPHHHCFGRDAGGHVDDQENRRRPVREPPLRHADAFDEPPRSAGAVQAKRMRSHAGGRHEGSAGFPQGIAPGREGHDGLHMFVRNCGLDHRFWSSSSCARRSSTAARIASTCTPRNCAPTARANSGCICSTPGGSPVLQRPRTRGAGLDRGGDAGGGRHVPDEVYDEARKQFTEEELANLTLALVAINAANRLNIAFRTVPGSYQVRRAGRRVFVPSGCRNLSRGCFQVSLPLPLPAIARSWLDPAAAVFDGGSACASGFRTRPSTATRSRRAA